MIFTARWSQSALNELMKIWNASADKRPIGDAVSEIEASLRINPQRKGESRDDGLRILFEPPLAVMFGVSVKKRVVIIISVWRFNKRRRKP